MYVPRGQFGARAHYKSVDLASRIEGASPHQLVQVMFEELLKSMDAMLVAARRRNEPRRSRGSRRARTGSSISPVGLRDLRDLRGSCASHGRKAQRRRPSSVNTIAAGTFSDSPST